MLHDALNRGGDFFGLGFGRAHTADLQIHIVQGLERGHLLVGEIDQVELAVFDEPWPLEAAAGRADREDGRSFGKLDPMDLGVRLDRDGECAELARDGRRKVKQVEHRESVGRYLAFVNAPRRLIRIEGYATFSACAKPRGGGVGISWRGRGHGKD